MEGPYDDILKRLSTVPSLELGIPTKETVPMSQKLTEVEERCPQDTLVDKQGTIDASVDGKQLTNIHVETQSSSIARAKKKEIGDTSTRISQSIKSPRDDPMSMQPATDVSIEASSADTQKTKGTSMEPLQMPTPILEVQETPDTPISTSKTLDVSAEKQSLPDSIKDAEAEKIPSEQTSAVSTPSLKAKHGDHDIEGSISDQQDETLILASRLKGWRFWILNLALGLGIFLSQMETTIVSTSLVTITNDLDGFQSVSWIVTSYLVTYTGFLAIISKMSDIFGRKPLTVISFGLFIAFSLGCGLAQDMDQLSILRAFQGVGGGGMYAMAYVIFPDIATPEMLGGYAAYLSLMSALACLLGPVIGGAINDNTTWRWVFWINVPIGLIALILILISMPRDFPYLPRDSPGAPPRQTLRQKLYRIDGIGTFLLLGASVLLVTALEEGGTVYSWTNAIPLSCLIISLILWIAFIFWEKSLHNRRAHTKSEAVFPWTLMLERFTIGCLWNAFFVGGMFLVLAITIPQRLQVIHNDSPFTAGIRILPLTLFLPLGTITSGLSQSYLHIPPLYCFLTGGTIHTLGISLLSTTTVTTITIPFYIYQAISGFGLGISLATSIMTIPLVVKIENRAVAMGSIGQFRMLGGAVILAIFANVLNDPVATQLAPYLTPEQLSALLQSAESIYLLPPILRDVVLSTYESGYQKQLRVLIAFSAGAVLAALLLLERRPRRQRVQGVLS